MISIWGALFLAAYATLWILGTILAVFIRGPNFSDLRGVAVVIINMSLYVLGNWYVFAAWAAIHSAWFVYANSESESPLTGEVIFLPLWIRIGSAIVGFLFSMGIFGIFQLIA